MNVQAFLITFREALEAMLIVGIIVTYLNKIGQPQWKKWVGVGVIMALFASFGAALLFQLVLTGFGTMASQVYLKFGIMFISVGLLTHMILFMAKQSKEMEAQMHTKLAYILTTGSALNMVLHSFLVTLREGVETVLFFAAISGGDISKALSSWGALIGVIAAGILSYFIFRGTRRVPLGKFFRITGMFLMIISAGLLIQGIGILQDLGYMGSVYRTPAGDIGAVYNITGFMAEHPIDQQQYARDTGHQPLINGQIGLFLKAIAGYTQDPSVEEFTIYWGYYVLVLFLLAREKKKGEASAARSGVGAGSSGKGATA
jgi:high-affinity iron transporter